MDVSLIIPAFFAGMLTFLAPCTLPLVPAYLGFISGVSLEDIKNGNIGKTIRKKVVLNGLLYVLGFSMIFILLGTVFAAGGVLLATYRSVLSRIGGVLIIFFGLFMLELPIFRKINFLQRDTRIHTTLKPGKPLSSFLFGATFAFGWTPCVGPILGTILVLASSSGSTALGGAFLLAVFSLGLALPFLLIAIAIGHSMRYIKKMTTYLRWISLVGGVFLILIGILLLTDSIGTWNAFFYHFFGFIHFSNFLNFT